MKWVSKLFHFFGSLYFAIFLIAITACLVIVGTILESRFDSHLFADTWIYDSLFFSTLLGCFFINILFSALRRWPFKKRHIPFLVTHLGLLMILAGTILKQWVGLQGQMTLTEGSSSNKVLIPNSFALEIQKKGGREKVFFPLQFDLSKFYQHAEWPEFKFRLLGSYPHAEEKKETWMKGPYVYVQGLSPIPIQKFDSKQKLIFDIDPVLKCYVLAIQSKNVQEAIQKVYLKNLRLQIFHQNKEVLHLPLEQALLGSKDMCEGVCTFSLDTDGIENPTLKLIWNKAKRQVIEKVCLQGKGALYTYPESKQGPSVFEMDLKRDHPILLFLQGEDTEVQVLVFDSFGRIYRELFDGSNLKSMWVYEDGFDGYSVQALLPIVTIGRKEKEKIDFENLSNRLTPTENSALVPPLQMLKLACEKNQKEWVPTFLDFLHFWKQMGTALVPSRTDFPSDLNAVLSQLEWDPTILRSCQWISLLYERLEQSYFDGEDILNELERNHWPFISNLVERNKGELDLLTALAQQLFEFANQLPPLPESFHLDSGRLLSSYFKIFGIDYSLLRPQWEEGEEEFQKYGIIPIRIETPITYQHVIVKGSNKLEDHSPCIVVDFFNENKREKKSFIYNRKGGGMAWPLFEGQYKVRFLQMKKTIPYQVRLHAARQINYGDTGQPYSYECDITLKEKGRSIEKTLSMNHVYETEEGYRFYLSGMAILSSGLKQIQLVINYDPTKYFLTYPGGIFTSLGIILLLWIRPYNKKGIKK